MSKITEPSFIEVYSGDFPQASVIHQVLEEYGIPAFLNNRLMGSIEPVSVTSGGLNAVSINVPSQYFQLATKLIDEFANAEI